MEFLRIGRVRSEIEIDKSSIERLRSLTRKFHRAAGDRTTATTRIEKEEKKHDVLHECKNRPATHLTTETIDRRQTKAVKSFLESEAPERHSFEIRLFLSR